MVLLLLPGVFGFLVWELKENWRLYEANRPGTCGRWRSATTARRWPGCSSRGSTRGRCPRSSPSSGRAERKALRTGRGQQVRKQTGPAPRGRGGGPPLHRPRLPHAPAPEPVDGRHARWRWARWSRAPSGSWSSWSGPGRGGAGLWLSFEEHSGWLVAGIDDPGWLAELEPPSRDALASALAGLYKMAGRRPRPRVDRGGARPLTPPRTTSGPRGWSSGPTTPRQAEVLYLLRPEPGRARRWSRSAAPGWRPLRSSSHRRSTWLLFVFDRVEIPWATLGRGLGA